MLARKLFISSKLIRLKCTPFRSYGKNFFRNTAQVPNLSYLLASGAVVGVSWYFLKDICIVFSSSESSIGFDDARKYDDAIKKCRELLHRLQLEKGIPGLVVGISIDGSTVWEEGFGYADVENSVPCTPETVMRIASISKCITMTAVAKLWEDGKLDLDKPIQYYVPYFPQKYFDGNIVNVTCRQLVSHIGGIRHYSNGLEDRNRSTTDNSTTIHRSDSSFEEFYLNQRFLDVQSAAALFKDDPLAAKPGTQYIYSTHGWTLVSAIVEKASSEKFTNHMIKLFKTIGMTNTYLDENDVLIYNRSRNYKKNKKGDLVNAPYVDNSCKWAGGGFLSTTKDLLQFGNVMLYSFQVEAWKKSLKYNQSFVMETLNQTNKGEKQILKSNSNLDKLCTTNIQEILPGYLKSDTVKSLWTAIVQIKNNRTNENYGMGWNVLQDDKQFNCGQKCNFSVYHTGGAVGASSILFIVPKGNSFPIETKYKKSFITNGIVIAIICNLQDAHLKKTALEIVKIFGD